MKPIFTLVRLYLDDNLNGVSSKYEIIVYDLLSFKGNNTNNYLS